MHEDTYFVSLPVREVDQIIYSTVVNGSITGELIDCYEIAGPNGSLCLVSVYEKHYYRAGNRLTLTVTIDDLSGTTRVHCASGGGGEGLFRFDWGAADNFTAVALEALSPYFLQSDD